MTWKATNSAELVKLKDQMVSSSSFDIFKPVTNKNEKPLFMESGNETEYITIFFQVPAYSQEEDFPATDMQLFAEKGGAFDFLDDPEEKPYYESDCEPL